MTASERPASAVSAERDAEIVRLRRCSVCHGTGKCVAGPGECICGDGSADGERAYLHDSGARSAMACAEKDAEIARLRRDADRLDFLDGKCQAEWHVEGQGEQVLDYHYWQIAGMTMDVRSAIDDARRSEAAERAVKSSEEIF